MLAFLLLFASLTGTWTFDVQTDAGTGSPTFVLKQDGEKLSGTYSGQLREAPVTGTVKGDDFAIEFKIDAGGQDLVARYTGAVQKDGTLKGKVALGTLAQGTFTATRKQ